MTIDTLFVVGGVALAFILGWRARGAFEKASAFQDALVASVSRDAGVADEALFQDECELPYRSRSPLFDDDGLLR